MKVQTIDLVISTGSRRRMAGAAGIGNDSVQRYIKVAEECAREFAAFEVEDRRLCRGRPHQTGRT